MQLNIIKFTLYFIILGLFIWIIEIPQPVLAAVVTTCSGDCGGNDFTPANGSTLSGSYYNINTFTILSGYIVNVSDSVAITANTVNIAGTLDGNAKITGGPGAGSNGSTGSFGKETGSCTNNDGGPGKAGSGASHGGIGGSGGSGAPAAYGYFSSFDAIAGSQGGNGGNGGGTENGWGADGVGGSGGKGGAGLSINVQNSGDLNISGLIQMNGGVGSSGQNGKGSGNCEGQETNGGGGGGGGGSGGTISLQTAGRLTLNGTLKANGDNGGAGGCSNTGCASAGGGGGGGRINIFYGILTSGSTLSSTPTGYNNGTLYIQQLESSPTLSPTSPSLSPAALFTSEYRCSEVKFNKNDTGSSAPVWVPYQNTDFSGEPIKFKYTFTSNVVINNDLTLFCQFKADSGTTSQVYQKSIKYIGGDPKINNVSCSYDPTGTGTQIIVKGLNFGTHSDQSDGGIKIADKDSTISFWGEDTESSSSASASAGLRNKVIAKVKDKLDQGRYPVILATDNYRIAKGYCVIGLTSIDFSIKTQCGMVANMPDVTLEIKENVSNAKTLDKRKIKLDPEGKPTNYVPKLEVGKEYTLLISPSGSLSKKINFKAEEGPISLGDIILLSGDIYGQGGLSDNIINAFDKAELSREWNVGTDIVRLGDLNGDGRVNSVDYACLRQNIGKTGDI